MIWLGLLVVGALVSAPWLAPSGVARMLVGLRRMTGGLRARSVQLHGGMHIPFLETNRGRKPTLVMLHGFGADKDNYIEIAPHLRAAFHLVVPDLPGFGEASKPHDADYAPPAQVERLRALFAQLGLARFHLAGSSMGGHIALTYAAHYPDQVQSLMLFDPGGVWSASESEFRRAVRETGENALIATSVKGFREVFTFVMSKPPFVPGVVLDAMARARVENAELERRIFEQATADSVEARIEGLATPTLVVWGMEDRVIHPDSADVLAALMPNTEVLRLPGIGHLPHLEVPRVCATAVKRFTSRL